MGAARVVPTAIASERRRLVAAAAAAGDFSLSLSLSMGDHLCYTTSAGAVTPCERASGGKERKTSRKKRGKI